MLEAQSQMACMCVRERVLSFLDGQQNICWGLGRIPSVGIEPRALSIVANLPLGYITSPQKGLLKRTSVKGGVGTA